MSPGTLLIRQKCQFGNLYCRASNLYSQLRDLLVWKYLPLNNSTFSFINNISWTLVFPCWWSKHASQKFHCYIQYRKTSLNIQIKLLVLKKLHFLHNIFIYKDFGPGREKGQAKLFLLNQDWFLFTTEI